MEAVSGLVVLEIIAEMMGLKNAPPTQIQMNDTNTIPKLSKFWIIKNPEIYIVKARKSTFL